MSVISAVVLLFAGANFANAASSLFGGATQTAGHVVLVSDTSNGSGADDYSGVSFDDANGTIFSTLTNLATDFDVTDDSCGGGSPRFQIAMDTNGDMTSDGNIFVYMGPSPSFAGCTSGIQNTGNLIGNEDAGRWDYTQLGGPLGGYSGAPANVLAGTILGVNIVVDGSWSAAASGGDSEQTVNIDNTQINTATYTFASEPETITVTIVKRIDNAAVSSTTASGASFPMSSTWNDPEGIGTGSGTYTLAPETIPTYEAETSEMQQGADYSTWENTDGSVVGPNCLAGQSYELAGYTTGDTREEAAGGTPSMTIPTLTDIQNDKFIMVWNATCNPEPEPDPQSVTVTIAKRINEVPATMSNASSSVFTMNAAWNDSEGIGSGSGTYELNSLSDPEYQAQTIGFNDGADYATSEVMNETVGDSCASEKPYRLVGYSWGETMQEAASSTVSTTSPSFTDIQSDKYVIVWNATCTDGSIGGDVVGEGELAVTSIESVDTTATADNSYENGWEYLFNVTIPTNESNVAMKFSDWTSGANTIPAGGNMRISSAQADNGNATIDVLAANTYTIPNLHMTTDLNGAMAGIQVQIKVEVKIPVGTANGSYSTNYGIKSE